jgi:hypothetical protein
VVVLRLHLDSCWGMSRRGRRDVEEGIVRVEHSGVFGVHEHRLEVCDKRTENSRLQGFEQLREMG